MDDISIKNYTISPPGTPAPNQRTPRTGAVSFGQMLESSLEQVNRLQNAADTNIDNLANGTQTDIHQTMIAVEKADVSFQLLMQIRNKLVAAYEQIMRTPI